jgi:hypothetical protein
MTLRRAGWGVVLACCVACGGAEKEASSDAGSNHTSASGTSGSIISGPSAAPPGGPYFLATPAPDSEYGWLVDGNGTKTRLDGIRAEQAILIGYDEKLWVRSFEPADDQAHTLWRQPIVDGVLQEAVPDVFPELVELSFDGRYALSLGGAVRLYGFGSAEPTTL